MPIQIKNEIQLEIAHVLFIDIVGYSKLLITEQSEQLQKLKEIVRGTEQFRLAEAEGKLLRLPTGDGGALVFRNNPEAPVLCAMEISKELKKHPELKVRMGVHSGPVNEISDLNEQANIAGAGINIAERVMDCGDAGHILLSQHVADDLEQYPRWRPYLHDLGTFEVKHGARVNLANLYSDEVGNPRLPGKFRAIEKRRAHVRWAAVAIGLLLLGVIVGGAFFFLRRPIGSASAIVEKSIAVLPFENLSEEKQNEYFTDGVQDEILTDLAKIADLKVISRTSVMQYKSGVARNLRKIGEELGVAHVVEGSVQRAANKIRVNAQLIDARTDAHLWAQTYDRDLADVFAIQSEIAKAIADQLQANLSPNEKSAIEQLPTTDVTAFDLYSQAKSISLAVPWSAAASDKLLQEVDLLNLAVERDPSFFLAYCELAAAHDTLYALGFDHTGERLTLGEAAVQAAFRLRPNAGEAHLARANHLYQGYRDYDGALTELEIARRTLANDPQVFVLTGYILRRQGKFEEALGSFERALALDPRNLDTLQQSANTYRVVRRYPECAAILDRAVSIKPNSTDTKVGRAEVDFWWKADTQPWHETINSIKEKNPGEIPTLVANWLMCALAERDTAAASDALTALGKNAFSLSFDPARLSRDFGEGLLARMMKDEAKTRSAFTAARAQQEQIVQKDPNYAPALCVLGLIDAGLGRKEEALSEGRRAMELMPVKKDALNGVLMMEYLGIIAAWVGEKDLACQQLAIATRLPGSLSYGDLKLMPFWDPLRGDPRFEKIVASLAPEKP